MPVYAKEIVGAKQIGARVRHARVMAGFKTMEELNQILTREYAWSKSRLGNYETGHSSPGAAEVCILAEETATSPCWIMFGLGAIRPENHSVQMIRHQNLALSLAALDRESRARFISTVELDEKAISNHIDNPFYPIRDTRARRFEAAFGHEEGWLDKQHAEDEPACLGLPSDLREIMHLYSDMLTEDRCRLLEIGRVLAKM